MSDNDRVAVVVGVELSPGVTAKYEYDPSRKSWSDWVAELVGAIAVPEVGKKVTIAVLYSDQEGEQ